MAKSKSSLFNKTSLYLALAFIVLLLGTGLYLGLAGKSVLPKTPNFNLPPKKDLPQGIVTLTGKVTCLPGKEDITTLACAQGFMTDEGEYYTIEVPELENQADWFNSPLYTAEKLRVEGSVSEDTSGKFDVVGKLTISSFTVLKEADTDEDIDED